MVKEVALHFNLIALRWPKLHRVLVILSATGLRESHYILTLLHIKWPKLYRVLAVLSAAGLSMGVTLHFNPTALRKAKTQETFGSSECNRVK